MMGSWQVSAILELEVRPPDIVPGLEILGDSWRDLFIHAALKYAIYIKVCPFLIRKWILLKSMISSWNLGFYHSTIGLELIYLKALGPGFSHLAAAGIAGAQKKVSSFCWPYLPQRSFFQLSDEEQERQSATLSASQSAIGMPSLPRLILFA